MSVKQLADCVLHGYLRNCLTLTIVLVVVFHDRHSLAQDQRQTRLSFSVSENATVGTEIGSLPPPAIFYLISEVTSSFREFFDEDRLVSEGVFITTGQLDHETNPTFDITVYEPAESKVYEVAINVTDVNDNYPSFSEDIFHLVISEASQVGSKFDIGSAIDPDSFPNNVQGYRIIDGNAGDFFSISSRHINGLVFADLIVNKTLNREEIPFHRFSVEAFDGGTPPKKGIVDVRVNISDVNDNTPSFDLSRYTVSIKEDTPVGTDIIKLNATDRDVGTNGRITYRIDRANSDPDMRFMVEPKSGRMFLNKKLDYEEDMQHKVVVEAVDGGSEPQVGSTVVIVTVENINDNNPSLDVIFLDSEEAKISEATEIGDYIARVSVTDPDFGDLFHVSLSLNGGDDRFGLRTDNNITYFLYVKRPLNREVQSYYHITLIASDTGSPPLTANLSFTLTVEDVNDNPPRFESELYEVPIQEDALLGTFVTQLQATDDDIGLNAEIIYRLATTDQSDWFSINSNSGLITTKEILRYSVNPSPRLIVVAKDRGIPPLSSNTTLVVKLSDASDGSPALERSSYTRRVMEDIAAGSCFLQVRSNHPDAAAIITYSIVRGSLATTPEYFAINSTTGDVCVTSSLDRETISSYEFTVQATDQNGRFDRARIHVTVDDVNEFSPVFHPVLYMVNVDRNAVVSFPVTQVTATDADDVEDSPFGQVTYGVASGNEDGLFELNTNSGQIDVAKSLLGYKAGHVHELHIFAEDGGGRRSLEEARVTISLIDGDSSAGPFFTESHYNFVTDEDVPISTVLGKVIATSGDDVTYTLRHDPPNSSWFAVHPTSGEVTVLLPLDREILSSTTFQIIASAGIPPTYRFTTVTVSLNDVNDNAPHFYGSVEGKLTPITVPYTTAAGTIVTRIRALDNDNKENGAVSYDLQSPYFRINETTGGIQLTVSLPQQVADYALSIVARDHGQPSHVSSTSLTVRTRHPDVNCPVFPETSYRFNVAENHPLSTIFASFGRVRENSSSKIEFYIDGTSSYPFAIYPNGSIYLDNRLDREARDNYDFQVTAEGHPQPTSEYHSSCFATAYVTVLVDDVNDNAPQFKKSTYTFHMNENLIAGTTVGRVLATDRDSAPNARVTYSFDVENTKFAIHPLTGIISTLGTLDRESLSEYKMLVVASDDAHVTQAKIHVIVDDVNDNSPTFVSDNVEHLAVVSVSASKGTWVADMKAFDLDDGDFGRVSYFVQSASSSLFSISEHSGIVVVDSDITEADVGIHSLTIEAQDGGDPSLSAQTSLKVKVGRAGDNSAQFSDNKFVFSPSEDLQPGAVLGTFGPVTPRRRRSVTSKPSYRIISGNDDSTFSVNETNGEVTLNRKLDYEKLSQYSIAVEKSDDLNGDVITLTAQFNVRDVNDHTPTFSSGWFSIGVDENLQIGREVWRFTATDDDTGLDGQVTYSLVSENPAHAFSIDGSSGALLVDALLDRENISEYLLVINATDNSVTSPRFSTVSCVVTVRDVNDNRPEIKSRSEAYVMEDEPIGYPVIRFTADDPDTGANGHVTYSLTSATSNVRTSNEDEDLSYFHIDSSTGVLSLAKQLDYERTTMHVLNISATDGSAQNPMTSFQTFSIHVIDVNDVSPQFERITYEAGVKEGQSSGVIVTRVRATDTDSGENGRLTYALQQSSQSENFTIDSDTGVITTTATLDRELHPQYRLTVFVQDNSFPSLYDWCDVNIDVIDINDNSPNFSPLDGALDPPILARLEIPEQAEGPEQVHVVSAYDVDDGENGLIIYEITEGNSAGDFFVNASSGELWISSQLDRERTASYRLKLVASDNGRPPRSTAGIVEVEVLDWNDNDPVFVAMSYEGSVNESLSKGSYVLTVRATDADEGVNGEVRYFLGPSELGSELEGLFDIDETTGVITTSAILDREKSSQYTFFVTAVDSAPYEPRNTSVAVTVNVIDANDNSPIFDDSLIRVNISRESLPGASIAHVTAADNDTGANGDVTYSFSSPSDAGKYFAIDSAGNVRVSNSLSELPSRFSINVIASDQGIPPKSSEAVILVSMVGEDNPSVSLQFEESSYSVSIWETVQRGFSVIQVHANIKGGTEVDRIISYRILFGNENGELFSISDNGQITVAEPSLLDYETKPSISLFISATTSASLSSPALYDFTTVNVQLRDDNDNSPRFSQQNYYTRVWEEQRPSFVMQLFASDADSDRNGDIRFHIATGDPDEAFSIDSMTGFLQTKRSLDREIHDKYELIIYATDQGDTRKTGTCTVSVDVVDINDHDPTLIVPSGSLSISEETAVGTLITTVTANDVDTDQTLTFYFASGIGNPGSHFSVDRHVGNIFLTKSLDYEKTQNITLTLEASDGAKTDSAHIYVRVTDVNDNSPRFSQSLYHAMISELMPVDTPVITVRSNDFDSGENGRIAYRLANILPDKPMFRIDPLTGVISTNASGPFSPQSSVFNLEIEAYDHGFPSRSQSVSVRIERTDVNDNAPGFSQLIYEGQVIESAQPDFSVINVTATDSDYASDNTNVYYEIVSGNVGGAFKIRTNNEPGKQTLGEIRVATELDRETKPSYELIISALDHGTPQMSSNATVRIRILDVNDNQPSFNQSYYYGSVLENNLESEPRISKPVLSVFVSDEDASISTDFKFKIIAGNDGNAFELTECNPPAPSCSLIVAKLVDYETKPRYELTVQVSDQRNPLFARFSEARVTIDIENVNEYDPVAEKFKLESVPETAKANQTLFHIYASDNDAGHYGRVSFQVQDESSSTKGPRCTPPSEMFAVEEVTGAVFAKRDLDFESCVEYFFYVDVCDPGHCRLKIPVEIDVEPIDEFAPQFLTNGQVTVGSGYKFQVPYGSPAGYIVGQVVAMDDDADVDGVIHYSLDQTLYYVINETTGVISLAQRMDSGNDRILLLTAQSSLLKTVTHVTIEITGTPSIPPEAQVLSIVFGVIAAVACLIVILLAAKHYWNKRKYRAAAKEASQEKGDAAGREEFCDVTQSSPNTPVTPSYAYSAKSVNGARYNANHENNRRLMKNGSAGDFQLHALNTSTNTANNYYSVSGGKNAKDPTNSLPDVQVTNGGNALNAHRIVRQRMLKPHQPAHTGNDGSAEDEEVNRITSTPSSGRQSSSASLLSDKRRRVADSGIQQDIDKISDNTDPLRKMSRTESVESIHEFGDEGGGEDVFDVAVTGLHPQPSDIIRGGGEEMAPAIGGLRIRDGKTNMDALKSLDEGQSVSNKSSDQLQDWTPEFQPLSSVFTEIAKLRKESATVRQTANTQDRPNPVSLPSKPPATNFSRPPPLITSIPQKSGTLAAPVPLTIRPKPGTHAGHLPLKGLYPKPNPQYQHAHAGLQHMRTQPQRSPPSYSFVISSRPSSGSSAQSRNSRASHHSQPHSSTLPFPPSSVSALTGTSLPRTPISHESNFTSPAMSPSLSPSLTPLTAHSPVPIHSSRPSEIVEEVPDPTIKVVRSRSDETNLSSNDPSERMVHV